MKLSIVFGYRDRELERVKRCLDSLAYQMEAGVEVIFVDYGSKIEIAEKVKSLILNYPFVTYYSSCTEGWPWSRSRALNIGIKRAQGEYICTNDIDMFFPSGWVQRVLSLDLSKDKTFYFPTYFLPKGFADWNNVKSYFHNCYDQHKGIAIYSRELLLEIGSYDEYYVYWGQEDEDLFFRLKQLGVKSVWLGNEFVIYHQWHPISSVRLPNYLPDSFWGELQNRMWSMQNDRSRNTKDHWGEIIAKEDRKILRYRSGSEPKDVKMNVYHSIDNHYHNLMRLVDFFHEAEEGSLLCFPNKESACVQKYIEILFKFLNKVLKKLLGLNISIKLERNLANSYLYALIRDNHALIEDFYLSADRDNHLILKK